MAGCGVSVSCAFYGPTTGGLSFKDVPKIKLLDVHPVQSWVVTADESNLVVVWDYRLKISAREFYPQDLEDERLNAAIRKRAVGLQSQDRILKKPTPVGNVRGVRFYDRHVLEWSCQQFAGAMQRNWVIVVAENMVLLQDIVTQEVHRISAEDLHDEKARPQSPTCAEPLSETLLAIGCPDGHIRIWDCSTSRVVKVLSGGHQKHDLVRLLSCPPPACYRAAKNEKQRLHLVSTASDGSVAVWNNHFTGNIVEGNSPSTTLVVQESSEALVDISFDLVTGVLMTAGGGSERTISLWDIYGLHNDTLPINPATQASPRSKGGHSRGSGSGGRTIPQLACFSARVAPQQPAAVAATSAGQAPPSAKEHEAMVYFRHFGFPPNCILACHKGPFLEILRANGSGCSYFELGTLHDVRPRLPDKLKIYKLQQHPLQDSLVMCATNIGIFVLTIDASWGSGGAIAPSAQAHASHSAWGPRAVLSICSSRGGNSSSGGGVSNPCLRLRSLGTGSMPHPESTSHCAANEMVLMNSAAKKRWARFSSNCNDEEDASSSTNSPGSSPSGGLLSSPTPSSPVAPPTVPLQYELAPPAGSSFSLWSSLGAHPLCKLLPSASGRCVALIWEEIRCYQILALPREWRQSGAAASAATSAAASEAASAQPKLIVSGSCCAFAWSSVQDTDGNERFAILEPGVAMPMPQAGAGKGKAKKRKSNAHLLAMGSQQTIQTAPTLMIRRVDRALNVKTEASDVTLPLPPARLFGGPLLCVGYAKEENIEEAAAAAAAAAVAAAAGKKKKGKKKNKDDDEEAEKKRAEVRETEKMQFYEWKPIDGEVPAPAAAPAAPNAADGGSPSGIATAAAVKPQALRKVGPMMPRPQLLLWEPQHRYCAHVQGGTLCIYQSSPKFELLCRLQELESGSVASSSASSSAPSSPSLSLLWFHSSLFVFTQARIRLIFPARGLDYHSVTIASHSPWLQSALGSNELGFHVGAPASGSADFTPSVARNGSQRGGGDGKPGGSSTTPRQQLLPPGQLTLLKVVGRRLFVTDLYGRPEALDLSHPLLMFCTLATARAVSRALAWAAMIRPPLHDFLAEFLKVRGMGQHAIELRGLSPRLKLQLCVEHRLPEPVLAMVSSSSAITALDEADPPELVQARQRQRQRKTGSGEDKHFGDDDADSLPVGFTGMNALRRACLLLVSCSSSSSSSSSSVPPEQVIERLRELFESCLRASRFNDAMFISVMLSDSALSLRVTQSSKRWAEATALDAAASSANEDAAQANQCLRQWNAVLRAERHGVVMAPDQHGGR
jgi:hypothetical protein